MKELGCIITFLCFCVAAGLVWIGYVVTFEESRLSAQFESTPKEGWNYWIQRVYWSDFRSFTVFLSVAALGFEVPLAATVRSRSVVHAGRTCDWVLFILSALYSVVVFAGLWKYFPARSILVLVPQVFFAGRPLCVRRLFAARSPSAQWSG